MLNAWSLKVFLLPNLVARSERFEMSASKSSCFKRLLLPLPVLIELDLVFRNSRKNHIVLVPNRLNWLHIMSVHLLLWPHFKTTIFDFALLHGVERVNRLLFLCLNFIVWVRIGCPASKIFKQNIAICHNNFRVSCLRNKVVITAFLNYSSAYCNLLAQRGICRIELAETVSWISVTLQVNSLFALNVLWWKSSDRITLQTWQSSFWRTLISSLRL